MSRSAKLASLFPIDCSAGDTDKALDWFSRRPRIDQEKVGDRLESGCDFKGSKISGKALLRYGDGTHNADLWISFLELDLKLDERGKISLPGGRIRKGVAKVNITRSIVIHDSGNDVDVPKKRDQAIDN